MGATAHPHHPFSTRTLSARSMLWRVQGAMRGCATISSGVIQWMPATSPGSEMVGVPD